MQKKETYTHLPDAELDIMLILWKSNKALKSTEILALLQEKQWTLSTVQVLLSRLHERGFIKSVKEKRYNLYSPAIPFENYREKETKNFIERIHGSFPKLIANMFDADGLSDSDMEELEAFLKAKMRKE